MNGLGWTVKMLSFGSKATCDGRTFYKGHGRRGVPVNFPVLVVVTQSSSS